MTPTPTPAQILKACEQVCAKLGLGADAEHVIALAVDSVTRPPREDGLTRKESALVRALREGRGRVLSVDYLAAAMASKADDTRDIVAVRLAGIRKKRPDLRVRIENVWGEGYRWADGA